MDNKTIFIKTHKGSEELKGADSHLSGEIKRVLLLVDDKSSVEELTKRAAPSLRPLFGSMLQELTDNGFIRDKDKPETAIKIVKPNAEVDELDFTRAVRIPTAIALAEQAQILRQKRESEVNAQAAADARAKQDLQQGRVLAEQETAHVKAQLDALTRQAAADVQTHLAAEAHAKQAAVAARLQADQATVQAREEAATVRAHAEAEAIRIRAELAAAQARIAQETAARIAQEMAQAKQHAEQLRLRAEDQAKQETEQARLRAEQETTQFALRAAAEQQVEQARQQAAQEAAQIRAELHATQRKLETQNKQRAEADLQAQQATEAARMQAAQATAQMRAELEAAKQQMATEAQLRVEAELLAKQAAEVARTQALQEAAQARAEAEAERAKAAQAMQQAALDAKKHAVIEQKVRQEAEAQQAAALAQVKAEAEAARLAAEQAVVAAKQAAAAEQAVELARVKAEAEAARLAAEHAASVAQQMAEAERLKIEQAQQQIQREASARVEAELKAQRESATQEKQEAELARVKAAQIAAKEEIKARALAKLQAKQEAEEARASAAVEAQAKREAEAARQALEQQMQQMQATQTLQAAAIAAQVTQLQTDVARARADAASARSMIATVLFFDVVGYTKQSVAKQIQLKDQFNGLVSSFIKDIEENQRIILDTGDGAAIGFLQHPEDAIEVAMQFRSAVTAHQHQDFPELNVRIGIHLGPVNVVRDMNGQSNMVGDGINDAQRIMSFAATDCIYISRAYYDVVSRLTAEYAQLFKYRGVKLDKHEREHQVYEVVDEQNSALPPPLSTTDSPPVSRDVQSIVLSEMNTVPVSHFASTTQKVAALSAENIAAQHAMAAVSTPSPVVDAVAEAAQAAKIKQQQEAAAQQAVEAQRKLDEANREMAQEQARAWSAAEKRAKKAQAEVKQVAERIAAEPAPSVTPKPPTRNRRKPVSLGKILLSLGGVLLLLVFALPAIWPLHSYLAPLEQRLSEHLHQPVKIAGLRARLLPLPQLELQQLSVGSAQELSIASAVLHFPLSALFSAQKTISSIEFNEITLAQNGLESTVTTLRNLNTNTTTPLPRLHLQGLHLTGDLALPALSGDIAFDEQGELAHSVLHSAEDKLSLSFTPHEGVWQLALHLKQSPLPILPDLAFTDLEATGELHASEAHFDHIEATLAGGQLTGNAKLNWHRGWQLQGRLSGKLFELQTLWPNAHLTGDLTAETRFNFNHSSVAQLGNAPNLDGTFLLKNGVLSGIDLVEATRSGASSGRTRFEQLSGNVQMERRNPRFNQLRLSAGVLEATGSVDVLDNQQLNGQLNAHLNIRAGNTAFSVSGKLSEPVVRVGR
jgi:Adenylate and Guanylate cyclase catalytic domain